VEQLALIITDGADSTRGMADTMALALAPPWKAVVMPAEQFDVTQLLASDAFFIGAESPSPPSFSQFSTVLAHINLAGRPCGVFSSSKEAADFVRRILRDSEAALYPDVFLGEGDLKAWTKKVLAGTQKN